MDISESDKFNLEKTTADRQSCCLSSDWQMNLVSASSSIPIDSCPCPSATMVESFNTILLNHPSNSSISGFAESNPLTAAMSSVNCLSTGKAVAMPSSVMFLPTVPGMIHRSLSHLPADAAFIEWAARFSCFNGGDLSGVINSLGQPPMVTPYAPPSSKDAMGAQLQNTDFNMTGAEDVLPPLDGGSNSRSPLMNQRDNQSSHIRVSGNNTHEASCTQGSKEADKNSSPSYLGAKKRKRINQDIEVDQAHQGPQLSLDNNTIDSAKAKLKVDENNSKPSGKIAKDSLEASKEDYVHIRARRGQATNSHSLAERVRREKISERMKYLQDLVPGCSKVTGKAVMLDEIINYVQSLQRQVEFLSMKLAAVNPRLDYNLEALLTKDLLHSHTASSSINGISREMIYLHPSEQVFSQAGNSGTVDPSKSVMKVMNSQLTNMTGYKDHALQMQNPWNQEFQNGMQMTYEANLPPHGQELNNKLRDDFSI